MTETTLPNPADFSCDKRERHYTARIEVRGTITIPIEADSPEAARQKAEAEVEQIEKDGTYDVDIDEIEVGHVYKDPVMFRVLRDGKKYQVSKLEPGDLPREPGEYGF